MASDVTILCTRSLLQQLQPTHSSASLSSAPPPFLNDRHPQAPPGTTPAHRNHAEAKPTNTRATVSTCSLSSLPVDVLQRIVNYLIPEPWPDTADPWPLTNHVRRVFPLTMLSEPFFWAVLACSSELHTSQQLLQSGIVYPVFWAPERRIVAEAIRTAFAVLRPRNQSCRLPQLHTTPHHDNVCLMRRSLILMQVCKITDLYIAWGSHQNAPFDTRSQQDGHDLCDAVSVSYAPTALKRLFVGNVTSFAPERVAPVLAELLRAKHNTLESIHVRLPCEALKTALQHAELYLPKLSAVTLDGSHLEWGEKEFQEVWDFFAPGSALRLRSACLSRVSLAFNHRVPPMFPPFDRLPPSVKCLQLVNNRYDMDVLRLYPHVERIELENQIFNVRDLEALGDSKKKCRIRDVSFRNCGVLFPCGDCKKHTGNEGALIRELYMKKDALLTKEGTKYVLKHAPNVKVLKVTVKTDVVPFLAVCMHGLKQLRVVDVKVDCEYGNRQHNYEWYGQMANGFLGCESALELIRVANWRVTVDTAVSLMKRFAGSLRSLQVCLRRRCQVGRWVFWDYAQREDLHEVFFTARGYCRRLRRVCLQYTEVCRHENEGTEWMFDLYGDEASEHNCWSIWRDEDEMKTMIDGFDEKAFYEGIEEWG